MKVTGDCLRKLKIKDPKAEILIKFARDYYHDANYYAMKDPETAIEAAAYAHGFIDAAILLDLIEIDKYHLQEK